MQDYPQSALQLADMGGESLCIQEMAAPLKPQATFDLFKAIRVQAGDGVTELE